uniref:SPX domain-containing protein n=1 Tax=Oryza glumipatula TaxID=40148 RepID=A0A0D9YZY2_9ORYZ
MVKFSREYEASIIPEWKAAFVDYKRLKKLIKRIKVTRRDDSFAAAAAAAADHLLPPPHAAKEAGGYGFSILDPVRAIAARFSAGQQPSASEDEECPDRGELVRSTDKHEREFMERADEELEKVNAFYTGQEAELLARGDALLEQLRILADVKRILADHAAARRARGLARSRSMPPPPPSSSPPSSVHGSSGRYLLSGLSSPQSMSDGSLELQQAQVSEGAAVADEVMAALERNGVSFVGLAGKKDGKTKDGSGKGRGGGGGGGGGVLQLPATVRIDIPATSPGRAALKVWEELVNVLRKDGADPAAASLNVKAFTKILKKFVKVSEQQRATDLFSEKVKRSPFSSSDKVLQLADEVECIFMKHFTGNDRKVAMKYLKPQQPRNTHMITFLVCSRALLFHSHVSGIFTSTGNSAYMEIVYHVFSMFALISLHIFLYGCNLFMWKNTRINHNFIFDFSSNTALTHRDAFLMSASIMCTVVAALVINLFLKNAGVAYANALPGALLLLSTGVLFCPFDIFYRSTRYCFMRVMRNIIFSPFYKVLMADFFMADQLTSQIPLLRHMEFTACYFMAGSFRTHPYETCTSGQQYKHLAYVISFLPYFWRALQCLRRYLEEGHDINQLANAGKYVSAMVAAAVRFKYAATPTPFWVWMVIISSSGATIYQLYWDFVKDWGFLNPKSKNRWLRNELILKNKSIYYVSMMLNLALRLAWTESVMKIHIGKVESRLLDFSLASLEIIRRGHWNFYRLENEHLNNVGKFRAVKTVPLPFRELETD